MKYEISDKQIDQIAKTIYKDVAAYIRDHKAEIATLLNEQKKEGKKDD